MAHGLPRARRLAAVAPVVLATACDPIVNVYGSFFPAWVLCLLTGVACTAVLRFVFALTGLEDGFAAPADHDIKSWNCSNPGGI